MNTVSVKHNDGYVLINGQPYTPGRLDVSFEDPRIYIDARSGRRTKILDAEYSEVINPAGGEPFASFADYQSFVLANFFDEAPVGGGITMEQLREYIYSRTLYVTATAEGSISDAGINEETVKKLERRGIFYYPIADFIQAGNTIIMASGVALIPGAEYTIHLA